MTGHEYGPHREADAGNAVVILDQPHRGVRPVETVVPMPEVLRRQRVAINMLAHDQAHGRG
jgi:hypothetical protein